MGEHPLEPGPVQVTGVEQLADARPPALGPCEPAHVEPRPAPRPPARDRANAPRVAPPSSVPGGKPVFVSGYRPAGPLILPPPRSARKPRVFQGRTPSERLRRAGSMGRADPEQDCPYPHEHSGRHSTAQALK